MGVGSEGGEKEQKEGKKMEEEREKGEIEIQRMVDKKGCGRKGEKKEGTERVKEGEREGRGVSERETGQR